MNGLALRINPSNRAKMKNMSFAPVTFIMPNIGENKNPLFYEFQNAVLVDEQLDIIKKILDQSRTNSDSDDMKFLSLVFLEAEVKHPIKCFLVRHITRSDSLQPAFSKQLSQHIKSYISENHSNYHSYITVVSKIATCIENFQAGMDAIKLVETELAFYLVKCLECCVTTIGVVENLAPTEKNEIFSLAHLALRLILCIIQKVNEQNSVKLIHMFKELRLFIKEVLFNEDTPMDTKTLGGILLLTMKNLENEPNAWIKILDSSQADDYESSLLQNESADLSLHSAIVTVVPLDRLKSHVIGDTPALIRLTNHIISIGERTSSESLITVSVSRTIVQISKWLHRLSAEALAVHLMERVLDYCWAHLEHYMDSVRHLAGQALANATRFAANLDSQGSPGALVALVDALPPSGKSRCAGAGALASADRLPAHRLLTLMPNIVHDLFAALSCPRAGTAASAALEALMVKHARECDSTALYRAWVAPALNHAASASAAQSALLRSLMAKAMRLDDHILHYVVPEINRLVSSPGNIRSVLILVHVVRQVGLPTPVATPTPTLWRGLLPYHVLYTASTHADDEIRSLCLALVAESPKSTEWYYERELNLVLHFLRYNANAQAPNFRQQMLALFNKFMKRLGDSYRLLKRQTELNADGVKVDYYLSFVERLREQCFKSLMPGANYSRRVVALQMLAWCQDLTLEGYVSTWRAEYVEVLLQRLEDSYDGNRALALRTLLTCPPTLLKSKTYLVSIELEDILRQASSLKPTDCVSASYKLMLLKEKLPEYILAANADVTAKTEPIAFALVSILLRRLQKEVAHAEGGLLQAARAAPLYGLLHCLRRPLMHLDARAISSDEQWSSLVADIISTCMSVTELVASVVNNSSPEGHLPMDADITFTDTGNSGGILLEDGRPVTAQMLLMCAWRSVKEVSLLLGSITSTLSIQGEGQENGTLSQDQVLLIGEHFTKLLTETRHRGAFEQAYVGFTDLLARLWQCRSSRLHGWARCGLQALLVALTGAKTTRTPTRRSAGLPFIVQAFLITELQVKGNPTCLHECMTTLLKLASDTSNETKNEEDKEKTDLKPYTGSDIETSKEDITNQTCKKYKEFRTDIKDVAASQMNVNSMCKDSLVERRTHCMNILRALFRNSALEESVAGYVGDGFMVALEGFDRDTWMERNAATLLFSALVSRVFGPAAARGRDSMTGRIFFLRYPLLYDYILRKLVEAERTVEKELGAGLFPVLTLLGRLYPSALEGALTALRLSALAPRLPPVAAAPIRAARAAAAAPLPALLAPNRYIPHIESTLSTISSPSIKRNYCHGILLQVIKLLAAIPEDLVVEDEAVGRIVQGIEDSFWILAQAAGKMPCYPLADEYVKMIHLFIWRFPNYIERKQEMLKRIQDYLLRILFTEVTPPITSGREICLANMAYLSIVILIKQCEFNHNHINKNNEVFDPSEKIYPSEKVVPSEKVDINNQHTPEDIISFIQKCLAHKSYEVVLSALNYILILSNNLKIDCQFQQHLSTLSLNGKVRGLLKDESFSEKLCDLLKNYKYLECIQKTLKVLSLEDNTQKYIVELKLGRKSSSNEEIVKTLIDCIYCEHENLTHIYLESLCHFVSSLLSSESGILNDALILDVIRVVFHCCTSENNDNTRRAAVAFLQKDFWVLQNMEFANLSEKEKFELEATLYAAVVICLEDDDVIVRQGVADAVWRGRKGGEGAFLDVVSLEVPPLDVAKFEVPSQNIATIESSQDEVEVAPLEVADLEVTSLDEVDVEVSSLDVERNVVAPLAGAWLRKWVSENPEALPLLALLALLDFRSEVCLADELNDECRVFDQNERYNIFLEETVWTNECADIIIELTDERSAMERVRSIIDHPTYRETLDKLCNSNLILFKQMVKDNSSIYKKDIVNPKIEIFVKKLLNKRFV